MKECYREFLYFKLINICTWCVWVLEYFQLKGLANYC